MGYFGQSTATSCDAFWCRERLGYEQPMLEGFPSAADEFRTALCGDTRGFPDPSHQDAFGSLRSTVNLLITLGSGLRARIDTVSAVAQAMTEEDKGGLIRSLASLSVASSFTSPDQLDTW